MSEDSFFIGIHEESFGKRDSLLFVERFEGDFFVVLLDIIGSRMNEWSIDDEFLQFGGVMLVDVFWERQTFGDIERHSDLTGVQVGVRGDDATSCIIHSLAHHLHPEETFLLFENLPNSDCVAVSHSCGLRGI